jgi:hypothetical protein
MSATATSAASASSSTAAAATLARVVSAKRAAPGGGSKATGDVSASPVVDAEAQGQEAHDDDDDDDEDGAISKRPRYEARCRACMQRLLHFFVTNEPEPGQATKYHKVLRFSEEVLNTVRSARTGNKPDMQKLVDEYNKMQRSAEFEGRSKAQNDWLGTHVSIDPKEFCSPSGAKVYEAYLRSLTKKIKNGGETHLGAEGQKA